MHVKDAIRTRRTIRKYRQEPIDRKILETLIDGARLAPSAANIQPLEYIIVDDEKLLGKVFETLAWAGYIKPEGDPKEGETPTAYIVVLGNTDYGKKWNIRDAGAAIMSILLEAQGYGIGSCWIGSVKREKLREILNIPGKYDIDSVIALGYPAEESMAEDMTDDSIKYYKDEEQVLHVPKRPMNKILHVNGF